MKRTMVLILVMVLVSSVLLPATGFARVDENLEKVLVMARQKFDIPQDLDFNYSVSTRDGKQAWNLHWYDKERYQESYDVSVTEDGTILNFNKYEWKEYKGKRLPLLSEEEAKIKGEEFIEKTNPGALDKVKFVENRNYDVSLGNTNYYFRYVRQENGIPYYRDYITVNVDNSTGEVLGYQFEWSDNVTFPKPQNIIDVLKAQSSYKDQLGISLVYNHYIRDNEIKIFPVYTPIFNNNNAIDAFTGDKIRLDREIRGAYDDDSRNQMAEKSMLMEAAGDGGIVLSPEEINAIEEGANLLTVEEAEQLIRDNVLLDISDHLRLEYSNLSNVYYSKGAYRWQLNFNSETKNDGDVYDYAGIVMDAKTGEILSYNRYIRPAGDFITVEKEPIYNREQAYKEVEDFLKKINLNKFNKTAYIDHYNGDAEDLSNTQSFSFTRMVGDVPFPGNSISVSYDCVNGRVTNFNSTWFGVAFPSVKNVISIDEAYDSLFSNIGLELQYYRPTTFQIYLSSDASVAGGIASPAKVREQYEAKLVYLLKTEKPWTIDAKTGAIVNYDGSVYEEKVAVKYSDIENSFANDEIETLAQYGISLNGDLFNPKENITQWDFFSYIAPALDSYYGPIIPYNAEKDKRDDLYNFLIREGIVLENEWAPENPVSREDGVKYIIRALNFSKIAKMENIFKVGFKDRDELSEGIIGYVAIASGINIIDGNADNFRPQDYLTREETAIMIYNLLIRE